MSVSNNLICGVCCKIIKNPYNLPCGHTFCLRPCLLPSPKSTKTQCVKCQKVFNATDLSPDYSVGAELCLLNTQALFEKKINNETETDAKFADDQEVSNIAASSARCSECQKLFETDVLRFCHHCYRNICEDCHSVHFNDFSLTVKTKLGELSREMAALKTHKQKSGNSELSLEDNKRVAKMEIVDTIGKAIQELKKAANEALQRAILTVENKYEVGIENLNNIKVTVDKLSSDLLKANIDSDLYVKDLLSLIKRRTQLQKCWLDAESLRETIQNLQPLPITKFTVYDKGKIILYLNEIRLLIVDTPAQPSHVVPSNEEHRSLLSPHTLPCEHSFCLEPCLVTRPDQTEVRCFNCDNFYPLTQAVPNPALEAQVNKHLVEERRSLISVCSLCQIPAPSLRDCLHCEERVCLKCWELHSSEVVEEPSELSLTSGEQCEKDGSLSRSVLSLGSSNEFSVNESAPASKQIFVAGVPSGVTAVLLKAYFSRYGLVTNAFVQQHRHIGYVTFKDEESVLKALSLPVQNICGATVSVKAFVPKEHRKMAKNQGPTNASKVKGTGFQSQPNAIQPRPVSSLSENNAKIFVGGLSQKTTALSLKLALLQLGPVKNIGVPPNRGFAVVTFEQPETAKLAISTHWFDVDGKRAELLPFVPGKSAHSVQVRKTSGYQSGKNVKSPVAPDAGEEQRKVVYVVGISKMTTEKSLKVALSVLGPVEGVEIMFNRGYAVVVFERPETAKLAIMAHWLNVDENMVEVLSSEPEKQASKCANEPGPLGSANGQFSEDVSQRKLYVEGFGKLIDEDALKSYFSKYGGVVLCQILGQCCCIIFEKSEALSQALKAQPHYISGQRLKLITQRPENSGSDGVVTNISTAAKVNARKLIVDGLAEGTSYTTLRDYFGNYGSVEYASVNDAGSWVVFKNPNTVNLVLTTQPHYIKGRHIRLRKPE